MRTFFIKLIEFVPELLLVCLRRKALEVVGNDIVEMIIIWDRNERCSSNLLGEGFIPTQIIDVIHETFLLEEFEGIHAVATPVAVVSRRSHTRYPFDAVGAANDPGAF